MVVILSQMFEDGKTSLCSVNSQRYSVPEFNYDVNDKQLLPIVLIFFIRRCLFQVTERNHTIYSDHLNKFYIPNAIKLHCGQAKWVVISILCIIANVHGRMGNHNSG